MIWVYLICIAFVLGGVAAGAHDESQHRRRRRELSEWLGRSSTEGVVTDSRFVGDGRSRIEKIEFTSDSGVEIHGRPAWRDQVTKDREGEAVEVWYDRHAPQRFVAPQDKDELARIHPYAHLRVWVGPLAGIVGAAVVFFFTAPVVLNSGIL